MDIIESITLESTNFKDGNDSLVSDLCIHLSKLVANYPLDCVEGIVSSAANVVLKFNQLCGEMTDLRSNLSNLEYNLQEARSYLEEEKYRHQKELNNAFKIQDQLTEEKNCLENKILVLGSSLQDSKRVTNLLSNVEAERNKLLTGYESLQDANLKYIAENSKLHKLLKKKEQYCLNLTQQLSLKQNIIKELESNVNDKHKWLNDEVITSYFKLLGEEISAFRNDILFVDPSVTQLLKLLSVNDVQNLLFDLSFGKKSVVFFCLNNCRSKALLNGGSHWSLVVYYAGTHSAIHYDSAGGFNSAEAKNLLINIGLENVKLTEGKVPQQLAGYECGLHVIVNAKLLASQMCAGVVLPRPPPELIQNQYCTPNTHTLKITDDTQKTAHLTSTVKTPPNKDTSHTGLVEWQIVRPNKHSILHKQQRSYVNMYKKSKSLASIQSTAPNSITSNTDMKESQTYSLPTHNSFTLLEERHDNIVYDYDYNKTGSSCGIINKKVSKVGSKVNNSCVTNNDNVNYCTKETSRIQRKRSKIVLLSDSHGRGLNRLIKSNLDDTFDVFSLTKPNGTAGNVLNNKSTFDNLSKKDYYLVMVGTNDIPNNLNEIMLPFSTFLDQTKHTNVVVLGIPFRHDNKQLNRVISKVNINLQKLVCTYKHATFLSLNSIQRQFYTKHGLHFNWQGKNKISHLISDSILNQSLSNLNTIPKHQQTDKQSLPIVAKTYPNQVKTLQKDNNSRVLENSTICSKKIKIPISSLECRSMGGIRRSEYIESKVVVNSSLRHPFLGKNRLQVMMS